MKNSNLIGAVMIVSLSFTACQKEDILAPRESIIGQNERAIAPAFPKQLPFKVNDLVTGKSKLFLYDDLKRLIMVKEDGKNMTFAYDRAGRVSQISITDLRSFKGGSKVLAMQYDGNMQKPSIIEEQLGSSATDQMLKTTLVKYDSQLNKISEVEMSADHTVALSRLFTYDARGNCIGFREIRNNLVVKDMKFADFDLRPSQTSNISVLALLPGTIFQKSNARIAVEVLPTGSVAEPAVDALEYVAIHPSAKLIKNDNDHVSNIRTIHYKYLYNRFGFPTDIIQIQSDFEETIQTIEYVTNR